MPATTFTRMEADRAFGAASRAARRVALACRMRRRRCGCGPLRVLEPTLPGGGTAARADVPLEAIRGTLEPHRAAQFDRGFRPVRAARARWQRVWLAAERGAVLPPVSLIRVGDGFAIRDGHHRVSVARARGALTIDAVVA